MKKYLGILLAFAFSLIALLTSEVYSTSEKWEKLYPQVDYLHKIMTVKGKPTHFHAVKIDVSSPGTKIIVSPPRYIGKFPTRFAKDIGAQIAINGGFWSLLTHKPLGLVITAGRRWKGSRDDKKYGFLAVTEDGRPWISPPERVESPSRKRAFMSISGFPMIVREGGIGKVRGCGYICMSGHPRTAIGLDRARHHLYMVVVDGRQSSSGGTDLRSLAEFMLDIGVWNGLNLDGGGSSVLYIRKKGGIVNSPCEGRERAVLNAIAVKLKEENSHRDTVKTVSSQPEVNFTEKDFVAGKGIEPPHRLKIIFRIMKVVGVILLAGVFILVIPSILSKRGSKSNQSNRNRKTTRSESLKRG